MPWWLRVVAAGARLQVSRARGGFFILGSVVTPVAYGVVFLLMAHGAGHTEPVAAYLVIAPALMGVLFNAVATGGGVITDERGSGTLELVIAAPTPAALVVLGRISSTTLLSLISVPLVLVTARLLGVNLVIADPATALIALAALAVSTVGATLLFASALVFSRSAGVIQNFIFFPLYIVSGIAFPLTLLPDWVRPLSNLVPITYIASVARASTDPAGDAALASDLGAALGLTALYAVIGYWLFAKAVRSIRANANVTFTS